MLKIFFSRTTGPISTKQSKLGWRGFKFVQLKGFALFQREIIRKLQKYINKFEFLKKNNLLLQNHWANFSQTCHKSSLGQGYIRLFKWRNPRLTKGRWLRNMNYWASFIIYTTITSLKCIHWFELVSQGNDVAYGPFVKLGNGAISRASISISPDV